MPKKDTSQGAYVCCQCNEHFNSLTQFYKTYSGLYSGTGHLPICKQCFAKLFNSYVEKYGDNRKAMQRICMAFDLYYDDSIFDTCNDGTDAFIGNYIKRLNIVQYKGKTFDTALDKGFEFNNLDKKKAISKSDEDNEEEVEEIDPRDIEKWGIGFDNTDYGVLNSHYKLLKTANPNCDSNQEIFINDLCSTGSASSHFADKDHFDIQLGHDFDFSNVESQTILENRFFDGTQYYDTDIKLFDADSPSFTLAIDSEFVDTNDANATLVSCFDESGSEGFRLRFNTNPTIQWGDKSVTAGYKNNRTMVVLRHIKGSDKLFTYVSNISNDTYDLSLSAIESVRSRSTQSDNVLSFGAIRFVGDGGHDYYAKGWVHWCKIWFDDLGDTVAKKLAAWTHETLRMEYVGADRYRMAGSTSQRANGSFLANNPLTLLRRMNPSNTNAGGWDASEMRTFLNTRVLAALPIKWQSAIKKVKISATAGSQSTEILVSEDYIYLAANREVGGNTSEPYASEGTAISFFTSDKSRLKFPGIIIEDNAQFITSDTDPTQLTSYAVKEGDIWIKSNSSNIGYIYMSAETIAKHTRISYRNVTSTDNIQASDGGCWVRAYFWWERSPYAWEVKFLKLWLLPFLMSLTIILKMY